MSDTNTTPSNLKGNMAGLAQLAQEEQTVATEHHDGYQDAVLLRNIQSEIEDLNTEVWHEREQLKASGS
ncbi:hypothetical protein [Tunturiibacter lichenicola]|uniref:hypothetical protein n=1 Tax=Tunturiibacter lichenicola TaxID=2051959 RepID=UPI003D9B7F16